MFKENNKHLQQDLFSFINQLPEVKQKKLSASEEYFFYQMIFCGIDESDFSVLYSDKGSRPNTPINILVSSLILMQKRNWTYEELFRNIDFDLLTRTALGLFNLEETPFTPATIFNFQNRLSDYYVKSGTNLLENVFDKLTQSQLKSLKLKTNIQRSDSFLASSNIRDYSRLQLLLEVVIRFYRVLSDIDKHKFREQFPHYTKQSSGQYLYKLKKEDLPSELDKLSDVYSFIHTKFSDNYIDYEIYTIFERVFTEHFTVVEDKLEVKSKETLNSSMLQSPDDLDATYRKKGDTESKGYSVNITETCHPENDLNLLTDISVSPNNKDDSKILNERIDLLKEKSPDLDEVHTDGAYGSVDNDNKLEKLGITHVQTAIKGRTSVIEIEIFESDKNQFEVSCSGGQKVPSKKGRKRFRAYFDNTVCDSCPHSSNCKLQQLSNAKVFYFTRDDYLKKLRHNNIRKLPLERKKLRPNVEASVKEFKTVMPHNKLKVRGLFKASVFALCVGIGINLGRMHRYLSVNKPFEPIPVGLALANQVINAIDTYDILGELEISGEIFFIVEFLKRILIKSLLILKSKIVISEFQIFEQNFKY